MGEKGANGVVGVEFAVAGLAIEAVEFEVFVELREADEALKGGLTHLADVFKLHVVGDEGFDLVGVVIGEAEAAAEGIGHADADLDVAVKADAIAGFRARPKGGRFADVVKENAPCQGWRDFRGKAFEHEKGVDPDVAFGVELRGLGDAFHGGDFGKQFAEKAEFVEEFETTAGGSFGKEFGEFFANALGGNDVDFAGVFADGGKSCGFDGVAKARGEADGAQHAELVFGEAARRLADGADGFGGKIGAAADEVEDFASVVTHQQAVDGEIAALNIFFG